MTTVFIPAKGVSKRIAHKNVVELGGEPLIWWTLQACQKWPVIDEVYVATEDDGIAEYATLRGAKIYPLEERDIWDQRTVAQLWQKFCLDRSGDQILFHITNPFRMLWELDAAWKSYKTGEYDVVVSVREERGLVCDSNYKPLINWRDRMTRLTQHSDPYYIADGSFYMSNAEYVRECKFFEQGKVLPFVISNISGIEIDELEDLKFARIVVNGIQDWWSEAFQNKERWLFYR